METTATYEITVPGTPDLILRLNAIDITVIVVYFALVMAVGIWAMIRANKGNAQGYFLAGRNVMWWAVGASLFSSNISSISILGMAGSGASTGIAVAAYELNVSDFKIQRYKYEHRYLLGESAASTSVQGNSEYNGPIQNKQEITPIQKSPIQNSGGEGLFVLIFLGWVCVPVYLASGVYTMPEYIKHRFGGERIRIYLAILSMILYIFAKISTDLYSGAIFIQQSLGWSLYPSIIGLLLITVLFTITGGLTAVIFTDALETVVMLGGSFVLMVLAFIEVGGYSGLVEAWDGAIPADANGSCGIPPSNAFHLFRDASDPDYPWPGVVFGITILSTWYFCTDQVLAQRSLASKNILHAKGGSAFAGILKILPMFLMVMPGMISRVLFPDEVACVTPEACDAACDNSAGCTNIAYPKLVIEVMPQGLRGLMIAAMLAALMSSLTSVFNSSATIVSMDLWKTMRPQSTDMELMIVGRVFVVILAAVSILWIPVLSGLQSGKMMEYVQSISSFLAPPICSCYMLAIFWKRMNEPGAFWGLAIGLVLGLMRMILEFVLSPPVCGNVDSRPEILTKVPFLYFAIILFLISTTVSIITSLVTPPPAREMLPALTWWTRFQTPIYTRSDNISKGLKVVQKEEVFSSAFPRLGGETPQGFKEGRPKSLQESDAAVGEEDRHDPWWKVAMRWICGFERKKHNKAPEKKEEQEKLSGKEVLYEDRSWNIFVNVCCVLVLAAGVFLWGFFA